MGPPTGVEPATVDNESTMIPISPQRLKYKLTLFLISINSKIHLSQYKYPI